MKFLWFFLGLFLAGFAHAQDITPTPSAQIMTPTQLDEFKETHLIYSERDFFGIHFYLNGREIDGDLDMRRQIATAQDEKATQYWKVAEDRSDWGWILLAGGGGMAAVGGVLSWKSNSSTALDNILVIGGLSFDVLGGLLWRQAELDQLSAVERYNAIVKEDNGISLLDLKGRGTGLAFIKRF